MTITTEQFLARIRLNPVSHLLLEKLPALGLPQCMLTAGCLFQTVWNLKTGNDPEHGIKDYDIFYFDDHDLSWEAEDKVIRRGKALLGDLADKVDIKNQARVHLWYGEKFGKDFPAFKCTEDGVDRYLISCTRVGVRVHDGSLYAPDHLDDMCHGILRMTPLNAQPKLFASKCRQYQQRWPWLRVEPETSVDELG
ncbi:nucleotidyltransferase family protein [Rhizobium ruizarguesonis]|uniref:nucleotidyltransferase family protein n=1 Tax=Rhizobium ruizarguesonis TaxID=2081791 RepID=UPI00102FC619|nr:nucleotidyltransferase family protein [Rhizobium ruizarguesonis]TBB23312.1 nucleotidyltransferase family protein [Rhizobium ruizarguesonis]